MSTAGAPFLTRETQAFVDALAAQKAPPLYTLTPEQARGVLNQAQSGPTLKPDAKIEDIEVDTGSSGKIPVRIVQPPEAKGPLPAVLYCHGGGWVMGNRQTHDRLVRELALRANVTVIFPEYTPSPEAKYPQPLDQVYGVLEQVSAEPARFAADGQRLAVAGDSVGGNMAALTAIRARRKQGPALRFQLLFYPVTDADFATGSYREFADGPWLTLKAMQWFWDAYLPDAAVRQRGEVCPLRATAADLRDLPPALVITAENDVLRDEGEAYARALDAAGVTTAWFRANGTIHDFVMLDALAQTAPAQTAVALAAAELARHLRA